MARSDPEWAGPTLLPWQWEQPFLRSRRLLASPHRQGQSLSDQSQTWKKHWLHFNHSFGRIKAQEWLPYSHLYFSSITSF